MQDSRKKLDSSAVHDAALTRAREKAERLQQTGMKLSANDRRVILIGQFLAQLTTLVTTSLPQLDATAADLLETIPNTIAGTPAEKKEGQLLLWQG